MLTIVESLQAWMSVTQLAKEWSYHVSLNPRLLVTSFIISFPKGPCLLFSHLSNQTAASRKRAVFLSQAVANHRRRFSYVFSVCFFSR